ncbi:DUF4192 domain-containing protein [Actinomycetes bacterium KLBMP 9797]
MNEPRVVQVRSIAEFLALVPYALGYHPQTSLIAVGLHNQNITFATRTDLAEAGTPPTEIRASLHTYAASVARQRVTEAVIVGYGPASLVDPVIDQIEEVFDSHGVHVREMLRVEDNRYFSYSCHEPGCCPPEGTAFDPASSVIATYATVAGRVVLPDRAALAATIAPVEGLAIVGMRQAGQRARARLHQLVAAAATGCDDTTQAPAVGPETNPEQARAQHLLTGIRAMAEQAGRDAVIHAFERCGRGDALTDDDAAWLLLLLDYPPVRDFAFTNSDNIDDAVRLWTDLTRRAEPGLVRAPASLLAIAAWRRGEGTLARLALDRALADDPTYSMAHLLWQLFASGISPSAWEGWGDIDSEGPPT